MGFPTLIPTNTPYSPTNTPYSPTPFCTHQQHPVLTNKHTTMLHRTTPSSLPSPPPQPTIQPTPLAPPSPRSSTVPSRTATEPETALHRTPAAPPAAAASSPSPRRSNTRTWGGVATLPSTTWSFPPNSTLRVVSVTLSDNVSYATALSFTFWNRGENLNSPSIALVANAHFLYWGNVEVKERISQSHWICDERAFPRHAPNLVVHVIKGFHGFHLRSQTVLQRLDVSRKKRTSKNTPDLRHLDRQPRQACEAHFPPTFRRDSCPRTGSTDRRNRPLFWTSPLRGDSGNRRMPIVGRFSGGSDALASR